MLAGRFARLEGANLVPLGQAAATGAARQFGFGSIRKLHPAHGALEAAAQGAPRAAFLTSS